MTGDKVSKKTKAEPVDMKLEVMLLGVSDVDRAKAFYESLGWRLDLDLAAGDFRGVHLTPHKSEASILAPYLSARENGSTAEEAAAAADRYMDEVHRIPRR